MEHWALYTSHEVVQCEQSTFVASLSSSWHAHLSNWQPFIVLDVCAHILDCVDKPSVQAFGVTIIAITVLVEEALPCCYFLVHVVSPYQEAYGQLDCCGFEVCDIVAQHCIRHQLSYEYSWGHVVWYIGLAVWVSDHSDWQVILFVMHAYS